MNLFIALLTTINNFSGISLEVTESWANISMKGNYNKDFFTLIDELYYKLSDLQANQYVSLRLDNSLVQFEEIKDYANANDSFTTWEMNLNKLPITNIKYNEFYYNIFLKGESCNSWLENINPISDQNPLLKDAPIKIIINDLSSAFGGPALYFLPNEIKHESLVFKSDIILPSPEKIKENVHFISKETIRLNPALYTLSIIDCSCDLGKTLLKKSCSTLVVCLSNEFYSFDRIVVDGLKRLNLKVAGSKEITIKFYNQLVQVISWIYEDRVATRKKLFNERLTLEMQDDSTFTDALIKNIDSTFEQAKERYNFVIIDRKDAYVKELKDLLKDLRSQSDLYALKIRTLISNFLRDTLAAIILIGFTIFTKFSENIGLDKNKLLVGVFYLLGCYYLLSMILQAIVDITDIRITVKELNYWKNVSKELIPDREFNEHRSKSLQQRKWSWNILYTLICTLYILIAIMCFKYPAYFQNLLNTDNLPLKTFK